MPRCKFDNNKFTATKFLQKYCLESEECIKAWKEDPKYGYGKLKAAKDKSDKRHLREKLKTKSDYEKELQKEVNTIVRLIDRNTECISSGKPLNEKYDAGHFYSCGSNPALRFHLFNIYAQSVHANQYLSGDQIRFLARLSEVYGENHKEYVLSLKSRYKELKLSQEELKAKIPIARKIVRELKTDPNYSYDTQKRIELRRVVNERLGIYTNEDYPEIKLQNIPQTT